MRMLVTGASGLLGGRFIRHLLDGGRCQVRASSRISRDWPQGVEGCVLTSDEPSTLSAACRGVDAVINLASMSERECTNDPHGALRANTGGTLALASAAAAAGVERFVQVSTTKVYGNSPAGRVTEDTVTQPRSHYAISHRAAEDYAAQQVGTVVLRLANGFGAPVGARSDFWDVIVNAMCMQAVRDRRVVINSSGRAWRNFVPFEDDVRALELGATTLPLGTYNVGAAQSMRIRSVAERVVAMCESTIGFRPTITAGAIESSAEPEPLDYRIDKLVAAGYRPGLTLDDELRRTLLAAQTMIQSVAVGV